VRETDPTYHPRNPAWKGMTIRFEFILGVGKWSKDEWKLLQQEQAKWHDLVLLPHPEAYDALNQKTHRWFQRSTCFWQPDYVLKVDDDVYVRLHKLYAAILSHPPHNLYFGDVYENVEVHGDDEKKNGVKEYMPFITGNLYVISGDLIEWLAKCPTPLRYYDGEDVSVGQWLSPLVMSMVDDTRIIAYRPFEPAWNEHGCTKDMISQHYVEPAMMVTWFQNEMSGRLPCSGGPGNF